MPIRLKLLVAVLLCYAPILLQGQTGNYFLSHYAPSEERLDNVCYDIAQDSKGVMYFATKAGILEFNGRDWDLLQASSAIYSIQIHPAGEIYWSGAKGFGKVGIDKFGFQQIESLSDSSVTDVFESLVVNDQVFFLTENVVYTFDSKSKKTTVIEHNSPEDTFLKLFELYGIVYVDSDNGVFKIENAKLLPSKFDFTEEVVFTSKVDNNYVIGTTDNKIYACDEDLKFRPVQLKDQAYIDASVIVGGTWLNRQLLALGTLRGGVVFVNPLNGITQEFVNYSTGLPDDEVFKIKTDVNQNVWVSHDYGFTKIAPYMPLRSFSHYQGLQGNLLCAYSFRNTVYVGTSLGLFKLEKVDLYDELIYYVDVEIKEPKKAKNKKQKEQAEVNRADESKNATQLVESKEEAKPKAESKKGGLFGFLKKKKKEPVEVPAAEKSEVKVPAADAPKIKEISTPARPKFRRIKKTEKVLRASQYVFKKVNGIDAKVMHLVEVQGRLLASGLGGLYEIDNLSSKVLLNEPIHYIYAPQNRDIVIVSNYSDNVRVLKLSGKVIENVSLFTNLDDQIQYAFESSENELWLCGMNKTYRLNIDGSEVNYKQSIDIPKPNANKTVGVFRNGEVLLANSGGFYRVDRQKNQIQKLDTLPKPSQYFANSGSIVYHDQHEWKFIGSRAGNNLHLLNVFDDLRFIASDNSSQNLWVITGGNELYKFFSENVSPYENEFPIFLKSIVNQNGKIANRTEIVIDQESSSVRFEVVQPDYISPAAVEFRYLLKGMQNNWSEWSANNDIIDFPYLPNGDYVLQVEAKNIFGKVSELEPLKFEVLPPYWKRSWFYAMEFVVFASLVLLSYRLSTRYRIVSRLLSLLTIILLIEFIQTVIGATILTKNSPVIDFFIQVVVALLVLPVEGYLRNLMLRSLDSSGKFYQFISPKSPKTEKDKPEEFIKETLDK